LSVFVDTSALYVLLVRTEREHRAVAAEFRALAERGRELVTSSYVLVETCALLQARFGLDAVRALQEGIVPLLRIRWIDEATHGRALDRLLRTDRRGVSLVDCASFVLMDAAGIREALAIDADFTREGYSVLPAS
jgi:predicted nucleic acid-binding protein